MQDHSQRPEVSVVMPFAGSRNEAEQAVASLRALASSERDELILVDNSNGLLAATLGDLGPVRVLSATGERSPAHARNVGAAAATHEWILFLDADAEPSPGLLESFFEGGVDDRVGAIAGEVLPAPGAGTLAARYGAARNFLGQQAHFRHPYRPRASAANLLVLRSAFEQLGGFLEGVRAGEDTDFTWRLQEAGWRLELRSDATVEHRYRISIGDLRRQWRGYAAGRAWLARRYREFHPQPAVKRALGRGRSRSGRPRPKAGATKRKRLEQGRFFALDLMLGLEELVGFALSNRPSPRDLGAPVEVVLVAACFPVRGDPLVEFAGALERVRVEALARPAALELGIARDVRVDYVEDEGMAARWVAALAYVARHPLRAAADIVRRQPEAPPLRSVAPSVRRIERDAGARIRPLGAGRDHALAERLAQLSGRPPDR